MAGLLPLVRGGRACPRTPEFFTGIRQGLNFSEMWRERRPPLTRVVLTYNSMTAAETAAIVTFFDSQRGSFDATWDLVLGRALIDGVISGTMLSSATNSFTALDVGKDVVIEGAGGGGSPDRKSTRLNSSHL